ncbi:hypothetical protein CsSME_00043522 [Camellia sinensis var. sinensis]
MTRAKGHMSVITKIVSARELRVKRKGKSIDRTLLCKEHDLGLRPFDMYELSLRSFDTFDMYELCLRPFATSSDAQASNFTLERGPSSAELLDVFRCYATSKDVASEVLGVEDSFDYFCCLFDITCKFKPWA